MEKAKRRLSCIVCPMSCTIDVEMLDGNITGISGFTCPKGEEYAREEVTAPKRMLTTTIRIKHGGLPLLPVVSKAALPKDKIRACARYLSAIEVEAPVAEGDVVCPDILGLGVDIVAARDLA
jgi:CxxC motif-containing protein